MQMTFLFAETHLAMYPKPTREWYSEGTHQWKEAEYSRKRPFRALSNTILCHLDSNLKTHQLSSWCFYGCNADLNQESHCACSPAVPPSSTGMAAPSAIPFDTVEALITL